MPSVSHPKGSIWRKWDLHIHSPLSGLANDFPMKADVTPDWEPYVAALEAVTDIPAIAVTDYFVIGCTNAVVKLDQIITLLTTNSTFRGRYLTAVAEENMSLMDWNSQDHGVRKLILQSSHILLSANPKSIEWCLGKKHPHPDNY